MPACLNDATKKYKGDEPSPKGRGFCAHAQELGKKQVGLDGEMWQVRDRINGSLYWAKVSSVRGGKKSSKKEAMIAQLPKAMAEAALAGAVAEDKVHQVVQDVVNVAGPAAGAVVMDQIAQIQARLQTAKRPEINKYLKAKGAKGFTRKGYLIQEARADAIKYRQGK
jgi:hypothetical protein